MSRVKSAIYTGLVRHRRRGPRANEFSYSVFMPFLNVAQIPELIDSAWGWSSNRRAPARFVRRDYLGDPAIALEKAVRQRVAERTGSRPTGPIYMLANLRYFGYLINPIACYYCYEEDGETLAHIVAEVTNTPWKERHSYVLPVVEPGRWLRTEFAKELHVSPFYPMNMCYHWRSNNPGRRLIIHLENSQDGEKVFDATLSLTREPLSNAALTRHIIKYPAMTMKVAAAIYWQALRLWLKRTPYFHHPKNQTSEYSL